MEILQPQQAGVGLVQTLATFTAALAANSGNTADLTGPFRAAHFGINISSLGGGSPTLTVTIQGKDVASGTYYTILVSTALASAAFSMLLVGMGYTAGTNTAANLALPPVWRVAWTIVSASGSITGTIGVGLID